MEGDICPKCGKGEEVEKLSKCYKAGYETLRHQAAVLKLSTVSNVIEQQWLDGRLRIHRSCRVSMKNDSASVLHNGNVSINISI